MNLRYGFYAIKLIAFAFFPLWVGALGLTYVSAHEAERPHIIALALSVAAIIGAATVVAPLVKLSLLGGGRGDRKGITGLAIVSVTIAEAILMLGAMLIAIWFISVGGPLTRLGTKAPEEWLFACVFIASSAILAFIPNLALLLNRGRSLGNVVTIPATVVYAGLLGSISPLIVTLVGAGINFLAG